MASMVPMPVDLSSGFSVRPDVEIQSVKAKWEGYCRDQRIKMTRDHATAWVKREKSPLSNTQTPPAKPLRARINETDAFRWRSETYPESLDIHPTAASCPTSKWPDSIRREYRKSLIKP